ncbi:hypothetical protein BHE74_00012004, partial [Ensete ventricosum]
TLDPVTGSEGVILSPPIKDAAGSGHTSTVSSARLVRKRRQGGCRDPAVS